MNRRQKEILEAQLKSEKGVLNQLRKEYRDALAQINEKIKTFQADIQSKQDALSTVTDQTQRQRLQSEIQSKIYQRDYQKALKGQVSAILDTMNSNQYDRIKDYVESCYEAGYTGTMYDLQGQGIPIIVPIDQTQVVKAVTNDTKLSVPLYTALGYQVGTLKKAVTSEISRGIATSMSWADIARNIQKRTNVTMNQAYRIARTEGHRVQNQAAYDAQHKAKAAGADIVKQWCATLDSRTRPHHAQLDGQLRELDEPFEVDGHKALHPGGFGIAAEDIFCRCRLLQRARWALDDGELNTLKERAEYFGLDKTKDFEEFQKKYLEATVTEKGSYSESIKRIETNTVDLNYIKSESFRKKFNQITDNSAVNDALRRYATATLTHRNGTDGEDLYIIDVRGNLVLRKVYGENALGVKISENEVNMLKTRYPDGIIGIHNHPTNILPTGSDFAAAGYRKYVFGVVATHSGRIYKYTVGNKPFLPRMLDDRIDKYTKSPYNLDVEKAHIRALNEMAKEYEITWQELE